MASGSQVPPEAFAEPELRMEVELTGPPGALGVAAAVTLRAFEPGRDEHAVYDAHQEVFGDDLGVARDPWEEWRQEAFRPEFDPRLWRLAAVGDDVVGICLAYPSRAAPDVWIQIVGVRRLWRRQGIAAALLTAAFVESWRAGRRRVYLDVDADNLGAIRLYERLGMHVVFPR
jgi:ribosomal protein S18 acetylase RimI-like enzyme